jgi:hypothetical protein
MMKGDQSEMFAGLSRPNLSQIATRFYPDLRTEITNQEESGLQGKFAFNQSPL